MYIEIHDRLGEARRIECTRVVAYDMLDNPVVFAVEYADNAILASTCDQDDFNAMLQNLGINKTVIVESVPQKDLRHVHFTS